MKLTVHIPNEQLEKVKEKLPPPEVGLLEAITLDAILQFLTKLERSPMPTVKAPPMQ
jgi:hypothetical protein